MSMESFMPTWFNHFKLLSSERVIIVSVLLIDFISQLVYCRITRGNLFPYGSTAGDLVMPQYDDHVVKFDLTPDCPRYDFYGENFTSIYIQSNGAILFTHSQHSPTPRPLNRLPITDTGVVAPFAADVDLSRLESSRIYYRVTTDASLLSRSNAEVKQAFPFTAQNFSSTCAIVATWVDVTFYIDSRDNSITLVNTNNPPKNTFQVVIVTDGSGNTFSIFLYSDIQWTTGQSHLGSVELGLGGNPAIVGFGSPSSSSSYEVHLSKSYEVVNIDESSNVNFPGKWLFHISSGRIRPPEVPQMPFLPFHSYSNPCSTRKQSEIYCMNGGTCYTIDSGAICACPMQYRGIHCDLYYEHMSNVTYLSQCGKSSISPATAPVVSIKIVGGRDTTHGSWPWMVQLTDSKGLHQCGATILTRRWVLTAAHCFRSTDRADDWQVNAGSYYKYRLDPTQQVVDVDQIVIHPNYTALSINQAHDIALIKLSRPLTYNTYVRPVCLPKTTPQAGTGCYITGWGDTKGTGHSDRLKQANVNVIDATTCNSTYYPSYGIAQTMLCAGDVVNGGKDTCQGDSGGPLLCQLPSDSTWYIAGITSWGAGCGEPQSPGVYTNVHSYLRWIMDMLYAYHLH